MYAHAIIFLFGAPSIAASIECLKIDARATAQWINAAGKKCTWSGTVGSNFGGDTSNGGE